MKDRSNEKKRMKKDTSRKIVWEIIIVNDTKEAKREIEETIEERSIAETHGMIQYAV